MTREEAIDILQHITTIIPSKDVSMDDVDTALDMAIKALSQMERRESKDVIDPYDMKYIRCGKGVMI